MKPFLRGNFKFYKIKIFRKNKLSQNPLRDALFTSLVQVKEKTGKINLNFLIIFIALSIRPGPDEQSEDPQLMRLDNMLVIFKYIF